VKDVLAAAPHDGEDAPMRLCESSDGTRLLMTGAGGSGSVHLVGQDAEEQTEEKAEEARGLPALRTLCCARVDATVFRKLVARGIKLKAQSIAIGATGSTRAHVHLNGPTASFSTIVGGDDDAPEQRREQTPPGALFNTKLIASVLRNLDGDVHICTTEEGPLILRGSGGDAWTLCMVVAPRVVLDDDMDED